MISPSTWPRAEVSLRKIAFIYTRRPGPPGPAWPAMRCLPGGGQQEGPLETAILHVWPQFGRTRMAATPVTAQRDHRVASGVLHDSDPMLEPPTTGVQARNL
jgi:hypothetical protein